MTYLFIFDQNIVDVYKNTKLGHKNNEHPVKTPSEVHSVENVYTFTSPLVPGKTIIKNDFPRMIYVRSAGIRWLSQECLR